MPAWKVGHFQNSKSPLLTLQRSPASSFALSVALSHSAALSVSSSPASSFVLVLSLCSQTLPSRGLTVALNLSVLVLSLSLSSLSLCRLRRFLCAVKVFALCVLAKGWFFISFMFEKHVKVAFFCL